MVHTPLLSTDSILPPRASPQTDEERGATVFAHQKPCLALNAETLGRVGWLERVILSWMERESGKGTEFLMPSSAIVEPDSRTAG